MLILTGSNATRTVQTKIRFLPGGKLKTTAVAPIVTSVPGEGTWRVNGRGTKIRYTIDDESDGIAYHTKGLLTARPKFVMDSNYTTASTNVLFSSDGTFAFTEK